MTTPAPAGAEDTWLPRGARLRVVTVIVAAFGPYLFAGFRTEQLAVYTTVLCTLPAISPRLWIGRAFLLVFGIWAVSAAFVTINAGSVLVVGPYLPGSTLAGIENYVYPVAVLLLVAGWRSAGYNRTALLELVCRTMVAALCVNSLIAAAQVLFDLSPILQRFWDGGAAGTDTVAVLAFGNGRLSGIFNQPAEAGIAYSLGLFSAVYLFARPGRDRPILLGIAVALMVTGGVLCVSKVFLLLGVPLALWQTSRQGRLVRRLVAICAVLGVGYVIAMQAGLSQWRGGWMLSALLPNGGGGDGGDLATRYTAQRFGQSGILKVGWNLVLDTHPWFGYGAGGLTLPYDSSWTEALVVGGLVGVLLLALAVTVIVVAWLRGSPDRASPERPFAGAVIALAVGATAGIPTFTANRVGLLLWILIGLLVLTASGRAGAGADAAVHAAAARLAVAGPAPGSARHPAGHSGVPGPARDLPAPRSTERRPATFVT
ncbi:hypothetical protein [Parafrankia discariae]|uniref:hypothetical protein n=1 Tax=Parafrankia discariae TaxID=365528 RepID=UPI0003820059|nr:hypothetical protein [Parafrankia discariae]